MDTICPVVFIQERWNGPPPCPQPAHLKLGWMLRLITLHVHQEVMKEIYYSHNKTFWREKGELPSRSKNGLRKEGWVAGFGFHYG